MFGNGAANITITGLREVYETVLRHQEESGRTVGTNRRRTWRRTSAWWWQGVQFRQAVAARWTRAASPSRSR